MRTTDRASVAVSEVPLDEILLLREQYRQEMDCQIVHDSWHARGFTRSYLLRLDGEIVGYGSIGGPPGEPKDILKEFFVLPHRRGAALALFRALIAASGARTIEAQTNDVLLSLMLYDCATDVSTETILFADAVSTSHPAPPGATLRQISDDDRPRLFMHTSVPVGDWGLACDDEIVATGGVLCHYNPPYGDIFMEVAAPYRRRGLATYLVQELKRVCRDMGRVPAARCHQDNPGSRRALERAGMLPCARIIRGRIAV